MVGIRPGEPVSRIGSSGDPLHLQVRLNGSSVRRWHAEILDRLSALRGVNVSINPLPGPGGLPVVAESLLDLDALVTGTLPTLTKHISVAELGRFDVHRTDPPNLILDICGDVPERVGRIWRLSFDGVFGEIGLLGSLLNQGSVVARVSEGNRSIAIGRLGADDRGSILAAFESMLHRTTTLILAAFTGAARTSPAHLDGPDHGNPCAMSPGSISATRRLASSAAKNLVSSALRQIYRLCYRAPHWRIGWRRLDGPDVYTLRRHPDAGWNELMDDGLRFYADPFPIKVNGRTFLFVEEFSHRTSKGIISAAEFGRAGPLGAPRPVLELPYHLSYPFVFAEEGQVWMIPESCASGTIDLFRATRFPESWVKEATLVAGIVASDATLVRHADRWWMFATVRDSGGSFSDALHIWSAQQFRGPWKAHAKNPVLIDIASARPAGRVVLRGDSLFRPVQDCRRGYGAALGIAKINQLDDAGFSQKVEAVLTPGPLWPGTRVHTLNSEGNLEFIDGSARVRRGW